MIKKICFFCGSTSGNKPEYVHAARELGENMAASGIDLVYGGGNVGNGGGVHAEPIPWQGYEWSVTLRLPPLAVLVFKRQ